ncbi:hypothetical protein [Streptodolium elevatio]
MFKSGVGFFALFGLGWWLLATGGLGGVPGVTAVIVGGAVTAGVLLAARRLPAAAPDGSLSPARRRRFHQVNAVQWLLIVVIAVVCARAGAPSLIGPLVAAVVGLHFLPLVAVFEQHRLRVPAAALVAVGATGTAVWLADGPDTSVRLVAGLGSAVTLWATAVWTLHGIRNGARSAR